MTRKTCVALVLAALVGMTACHRKPVNVLLVTFDTTRADHVGYAMGKKGVTPMLDALAHRGTWFSTCVTPQPLTLPSHTSIMTGLYPFHHGVRNNGTYIVPGRDLTLAERFHDAGYATHAVISAFVLDSRFGLDQGFDSYDDDLSGGPKQKMFMFKEVKAKRTAERAVRWLRSQRPKDRPFFLWVHFFDPHADYDPPPEWAAKLPGDPYQGEIAYADHELGYILKELDDEKLLDDTVVAFTGDHGDGLGQHGEKTHSLFIYESTTRVPLLFSGPGVPAGMRIDELVRTIDIAPTLLELAHIGVPKNLDGTSLVPVWHGHPDHRVAYLETFVPRLNFGWSGLRGMRDATTKVILAPRPEVYDLAKDPGETNNLLRHGTMPEDARKMFAELKTIVRDDPFTHGEQQEGQVDQETRRKLASLGYVWGAPAGKEGELPDPKDRITFWEQFQHAQSLIRGGQYEQAQRETEALLEDDPNNVVAMGSLAMVLGHLHEQDKALAIYRRMMELDPHRGAAYLGAARILGTKGRYDDAVATVHRFLAIQPNDVEAYTVLGDLALDREDYPTAEAAFRKALKIDPHSSLAASGLGNCLNRSGRVKEARDLLAEYHRKDPTSHAIAYNLAVVSERLGDPKAALALYEQAIKLDPDHSMSWNNLGSLLSRQGKLREAIACVAKAHQLDPDNVEATYNLGALLARAGRPQQALALVEQALEQRPALIQAAILRAQVLERLGRKREALAQWRRLGRDNPGALLQVARLELALGNHGAARAALGRAIARGGERVRAAAMKNPKLRGLL
ncbi:MAG: sulfatase-like hydrolase/transferase [Acidobacteria bacterium]|nr:sulfatase-like hydrolase/transferase [Acidobacteriota bacterium]